MKRPEELGLVLGPKGKTPAYYFAKGAEKRLSTEIIDLLKDQVRGTPGAAARVCFHDGPQAPVHDMVIVFRGGGPAQPAHKHLTREETYHIIEGKLRLQFFDDKGKKTGACTLGASGTGLPLVYRVPHDIFHATEPDSEFAVFHESRPGPFEAADTVVSDWKP